MLKRALFIPLFTIGMMLTACGTADDEDVSTVPVDSEQETNDSDQSNDNNESENDSSSGSFKVEAEDQLDLGIGDTGYFDTTLGTYEITLNSAKLIEDEVDGE